MNSTTTHRECQTTSILTEIDTIRKDTEDIFNELSERLKRGVTYYRAAVS